MLFRSLRPAPTESKREFRWTMRINSTAGSCSSTSTWLVDPTVGGHIGIHGIRKDVATPIDEGYLGNHKNMLMADSLQIKADYMGDKGIPWRKKKVWNKI